MYVRACVHMYVCVCWVVPNKTAVLFLVAATAPVLTPHQVCIFIALPFVSELAQVCLHTFVDNKDILTWCLYSLPSCLMNQRKYGQSKTFLCILFSFLWRTV